ncbi:rod shape-determining protein [Geoalkalibacter halelectricus]|uniref:Rod shape-determining protein n=1 Tax=Geoalkalibacter halelectricus TaxID=2847045 RepID=A0ABY5ZNT8_9BACT|nr:rod shape-determining protein [Geoalkalibacter halelectricus]MDO3377223.1 rod shape-determining protein [Geoalkalibacter halelectricus]UWZ79354.1 rod shape-determining protein [Geoalkalibacter halelectricus]
MEDFHPLRSWRPRVAVDVGTAYIRVARLGAGVEIHPLAAAPAPPLRQGVVADPVAVAAFLRPGLERARRWGMLGPRVLVGAPTDAREDERALLHQALRAAGAAEVEIVPEPCAAALGAGVDLSSPYAQMIVDVGEGVTDCAILRCGEIVATSTLRVGCADLREQVRLGLLDMGHKSLQAADPGRILTSLGVSEDAEGAAAMRVVPADVDAGAPVHISAALVRALVAPVVARIVGTVADFLRGAPPEPGCEIIESGIFLTGGGALVPGLAGLLAEATAVPIHSPPHPLDAVILGLRRMAAAP